MSPGATRLDNIPPNAAWGVDSRNSVLCVERRALRICTAASVVSINTTSGDGSGMQVEVELSLLRDCDHNAMGNLLQMASPSPGTWTIRAHSVPADDQRAAPDDVPENLTMVHRLTPIRPVSPS